MNQANVLIAVLSLCCCIGCNFTVETPLIENNATDSDSRSFAKPNSTTSTRPQFEQLMNEIDNRLAKLDAELYDDPKIDFLTSDPANGLHYTVTFIRLNALIIQREEGDDAALQWLEEKYVGRSNEEIITEFTPPVIQE